MNAWTGVGYLTATATSGAFPGHTLDDVQSGIGVVRHQPHRGDHRTAARRLRRRAPLVGAAEDLRLRAARLKTDTRPLSYGSPEKGETMTMTAI
ncbi:hypothetical protein ACFQ6E_33380 [Streptomyces sp. NPDC056462]|uniref:hypothetical protein n=1 Tax=Streptomyces sp. NPDC056462 TaxID=3345826 RepID=UPI0036823416